MYFQKLIFISFILSFYANVSMATVYENAENGTTENWVIHDNIPSGASIENVYDPSKNSHVIKFQGEQRRNAYRIGERKSFKGWNNKKEFILKWKMNFAEKFKITVYTHTAKGLRVFHYTHKNHNKGFIKRYIKIGLGKNSMNGTWQSFSRNLATDLKTYEPNNKLLAVNGIKIQGSGKIDDISLISKENEIPCITREALIKKINNNEDVTKVNTSCITDMSRLFSRAEDTFNQDIGNWDVSNVTTMKYMFAARAPGSAPIFNQDIGNWDVSNVTNMESMFQQNINFNQDITKWNLSKVTTIERMFYRAEAFNQNIEKWDVSNISNMVQTLLGTNSFKNHDLTQWDVSKVNNHLQFLKDSGENNQEPNWEKELSKEEQYVKNICTTAKIDKNVVCIKPFHLAYYLNQEGPMEINTLHLMSMEKGWKEIRKKSLNNYDIANIKAINNTPLIELSISQGHSEDIYLYYGNLEKETLQSVLFIPQDDLFRIKNITAIKKGKELLIQSIHRGTGVLYFSFYDIAHLPNILFIEKNKMEK